MRYQLRNAIQHGSWMGDIYATDGHGWQYVESVRASTKQQLLDEVQNICGSFEMKSSLSEIERRLSRVTFKEFVAAWVNADGADLPTPESVAREVDKVLGYDEGTVPTQWVLDFTDVCLKAGIGIPGFGISSFELEVQSIA